MFWTNPVNKATSHRICVSNISYITTAKKKWICNIRKSSAQATNRTECTKSIGRQCFVITNLTLHAILRKIKSCRANTVWWPSGCCRYSVIISCTKWTITGCLWILVLPILTHCACFTSLSRVTSITFTICDQRTQSWRSTILWTVLTYCFRIFVLVRQTWYTNNIANTIPCSTCFFSIVSIIAYVGLSRNTSGLSCSCYTHES